MFSIKSAVSCFSVEVPLLPLTGNTDSHRFFLHAGSQALPSDSPALLIKFYLTDSFFFAKSVKSYVHKLPASQISSLKKQKSCYHSSRQDLVQAQTLARCSRNRNWSTGPIIDMPCKNLPPHTCGQILTFSSHPSVGITQIRCGRRFIFLSACHTSSRFFILVHDSTYV